MNFKNFTNKHAVIATLLVGIAVLVVVVLSHGGSLLKQDPTSEELTEGYEMYEAALGSPSSEMSLEDIEFWVAKVRHHHELIEQSLAVSKSKRLALTAICRARPEAQKLVDAAVACTNVGCREKARNELLAWRDGCLREVK